MSDQQPQEIEIEAIGVEVASEPVELYKMMKLANVVSAGAEAKHLIAQEYVAVNGELETRKRRKMFFGDFFQFDEEFYVLVENPQAENFDSEGADDYGQPFAEDEQLDWPEDSWVEVPKEQITADKSASKQTQAKTAGQPQQAKKVRKSKKKPQKKVEQGVKNKSAVSRFKKQNNKKKMPKQGTAHSGKANQSNAEGKSKTTGRKNINFI
ncbi:RNA-binding S4 domain-containing protein [Paraferrimonas sp. SM1919]|uniref:RNA-binding S4 domain-containing protein n=1 Tax=Paraferrimonas sp. SM1919 TaxID=2662263 RepID=UPI0013D1ED17|nr:RNA-binding S4 domain-containing protein [Paraferrimonas sp. SM1919]